MAQQYEALYSSESNTFEVVPLFAGDFSRQEKQIVVAQGAPAMVRGAALGVITASGKYAPYDPEAEDGSEVPAGVLGVDLPAASSGDLNAFCYISGCFNIARVLDKNGDDLTDEVGALEAKNIYLREVK